ncbi:MAG: hypothetical protein M3R07_06135, partial [Gemmatimonadota bacterium]|nr:hypothetical protein [Gemmatimonadota bacterium]
MKALITLTDVDVAVRLNAVLEQAGVETVMVSPVDDTRREIDRSGPEVIVVTGAIADQANLQVIREQLWEGVAVIGLADVEDPDLRERLKGLGFVDLYTKPVPTEELAAIVRRALDRQRLVKATGLIG